MMGSVFAMQGIGQLVAALVALLATVGFKDSLVTSPKIGKCDHTCVKAVDQMWRIVVGFGAVPGCIALYYRLTIPETPRYTFDIARDIERGTADARAYIAGRREGDVDELRQAQALQQDAHRIEVPKASFKDFTTYYSKWKNGKILLGTAGSWFFLDIAFYGLSLNNSVILTAIGYSGGSNVYKVLFNNAVGNWIIVCAGTVPGYWFTVALCDTIGRKPIQIGGFIILTILFTVHGFAYHHLSSHAIFAIIVLAQFFIQFGKTIPSSTVDSIFISIFRSEHHDLHRPWGMLPDPVQINFSWHICCGRQDWVNHRPSRLWTLPYSRSSGNLLWRSLLSLVEPCHANFCTLYDLRSLYLVPCSGDR
jgi:PHS family inorganic phosphate transporter-like MFS transporter